MDRIQLVRQVMSERGGHGSYSIAESWGWISGGSGADPPSWQSTVNFDISKQFIFTQNSWILSQASDTGLEARNG